VRSCSNCCPAASRSAAWAPPLAEAGIPLLPIATHDTDYLFLREADLARGIAALERAGHRVHSWE